jgi:hypothetical protein
MVELYLHSPSTPSWRGDQLGEHMDNFTLLYLLCTLHENIEYYEVISCFKKISDLYLVNLKVANS